MLCLVRRDCGNKVGQNILFPSRLGDRLQKWPLDTNLRIRFFILDIYYYITICFLYIHVCTYYSCYMERFLIKLLDT